MELLIIFAIAIVVVLALLVIGPEERWRSPESSELPDPTLGPATYEVRLTEDDRPQFAVYIGNGYFELLASAVRVTNVHSWRRVA